MCPSILLMVHGVLKGVWRKLIWHLWNVHDDTCHFVIVMTSKECLVSQIPAPLHIV